MGTRARRRVRVNSFVRIFQSLKDFTGWAPESIYQTPCKISNFLSIKRGFLEMWNAGPI
jgi:hypothetical protein